MSSSADNSIKVREYYSLPWVSFYNSYIIAVSDLQLQDLVSYRDICKKENNARSYIVETIMITNLDGPSSQ